MECSTVADRIAAYLDGELARSEREMFEVHLESCEGCQALVERGRHRHEAASDPAGDG